MPSDKDPTPPMNHVFVDFENVHEVDSSLFSSKTATFTLLLGAKQTKLDVSLVEQLMAHAASVQLVRLKTSGRNALDFTLAYYVGRAVVADPTAWFHIISKDTGFDPLIEHLLSRRIHARRHADFSSLTFSATPKPIPMTPVSDDLLKRALEHLQRNLTNRPKKKSTLASHLLSVAGKSSNEVEITKLIEKLRAAGHLSINDKNAVTYHV